MAFVLFFAFPVINAFANEEWDYRNGYFDNGGLDNIRNDISSINALFDNDLTKGVNINGSREIFFNEPVDIEGFYISHPYVPVLLKIYFEDDETVVHKADYKKEYNVKKLSGVKKIVLQTTTNIRINEFDIFTTETITKPNVDNLTHEVGYDSVLFSWVNPDDNSYEGLTIKKDGVEIADLNKNMSSYKVSGLSPETSYEFELIAKYPIEGSVIPIKIIVDTKKEPVDETPPENISHVNVTPKQTIASFSYTLPSDSDFSHLVIYRNNVAISDNHKEDTFLDTGLIPNKTYTYKFVSVDIYGNVSSGYVVTVTTEREQDNIPPAPPRGLKVQGGNQSLKLTWKKNEESDLKGYNVFLNGVRINESLVYSTHFVISGLDNNQMYNLQVSAVDTSDNESVLSEIVSMKPNPEAMPIFETDYDLDAVGMGVSNWFSALWLILAFSVGIPLAFYVASRIKALFFS